MVGSLHERSFTAGFLRVLFLAQYTLLFIFNHCLKSFLKIGAVITYLLIIILIIIMASETGPNDLWNLK